MPTLTIRDEATGSTPGTPPEPNVLEFLTDHITVRELIRERVYQEVQDHNRRQPPEFKMLVQPTDAERTLNGYRLKTPRQLDWKPQFDKACEAFERNGILILIDDHQAESLEEQITIRPGTEVTFLKLTPLVGG